MDGDKKINSIDMKSQNSIKKKMGISLLIAGGIFLLIGITSFIVKTYTILQEGSFQLSVLESYVPGFILLLIGYALFVLGRNLKDLNTYLGKLAITAAAFFFSGAIILFSFYTEVTQISENIQPTLDHVIIEYIYSQDGEEIEILQDLLNTTITFETFSANSLTQKQQEFIIQSFKIEAMEDLSSQEINDLPAKIISSIYIALKTQNQESILNSPLPIKQIITFLESAGNLELTLLSMSYLYDVEPQAELLIMIPSEIQYNTSQENLQNIRDQCSSLEKNQICDAFKLSEYENLVQYLLKNDTLPIEINISVLENIDTIEKLEVDIKEKTSFYGTFFLLSIAFLLFGYIIFENKNKKLYVHSSMVSFQEIITVLLKYFLFPTVVISILFLLIKMGFLIDLFQNSLNVVTQNQFPISMENLPIIENMKSFVGKLFLSHIIISLTLVLFYLGLKKTNKNLITKELV